MLHLRFIRHHARFLTALALVALASWLVLSGHTASASNTGSARPAKLAARTSSLSQQPSLSPANFYRQTNLVSDIPGFALIEDPLLRNPWGVTESSTSPFWVSNQQTGTSTLYGGDVAGSPFTKNPLNVTVQGGLPTGVVFNGSADFQVVDPCVTPPCPSGAARFIFASLSGNITAWKPGATVARIMNTKAGHVYTGLAIGNNGSANFLYAADFANRKIDVYDKNFALVTLAGNFTDPTLPAGYAPFNIQNLGGKLYVMYAKVNPMTGEDDAGPGNGFVSVFDANGVFQNRLISNGPLNSPWGVTIAPASFSPFGGALLVGNFGDGRINAFNATTGAFLGTLNDETGNPIEIENLWALNFGNGVGGGDANTLYFSAGYDDEEHGLFGSLKPSAAATTTIQLSASDYVVNEGSSAIDITVTRSGDLSVTSTVNYTTFDESDPSKAATQGRDYILAAGTLTFAAGQASKTFTILIPDDAYVENNEQVDIALSNPTNAALGDPEEAHLTIVDNDGAGINPPPRVFVATMSGAQEVPSNATTGRGVGILFLSPDETTAKVSFYFAGLTGNPTGAHIHGPAAPGATAPILFPFSGLPASPSGSVNNQMITLNATQVQQLKSGLLYMNVHTSANPGGEIRGQLLYNPIDDAGFFVREHYYDFLNRYPDSGGLSFWTQEINKCGPDVLCYDTRRTDVSAAFFLSAEFQQTGFFVYSVRRAALGTQPTYGQYLIDKTLLSAGTEANKTAFAEAFVQRPEFLAKYPASQNGSDFIDALIATIKGSSGVDLTPRRAELVNEYLLGATQVQSRARVIRKAISYTEFTNAEFNPAFVLSEYFGYLRRDPDPGGYAFWLGRLNANSNNYRSMVCAFLTSAEYQLRFGPTVTRTDKECQDLQ